MSQPLKITAGLAGTLSVWGEPNEGGWMTWVPLETPLDLSPSDSVEIDRTLPQSGAPSKVVIVADERPDGPVRLAFA